MTATLVVLYTAPADPAAFDDHYESVHAPLVDKVPGLLGWEHSKLAPADGGEATFYQVATLRFPDAATLRSGLGSPEGAAAAEDFAAVAPPGSRMYVTT